MDRNKPYIAFQRQDALIVDNGFRNNYDKTRVLYDGRYCAVAGFIFAVVEGRYCVLANLRGNGTPDFQGYWNCPCGFLERGENSQQGTARETYEECGGFCVEPSQLKVVFVQTEPSECNNGNVTIHHTAFVGKQHHFSIYLRDRSFGGELNEVKMIAWIPVSDIDQYEWAFGHDKSIKQYAPSFFKRKLVEFYYRIFK